MDLYSCSTNNTLLIIVLCMCVRLYVSAVGLNVALIADRFLLWLKPRNGQYCVFIFVLLLLVRLGYIDIWIDYGIFFCMFATIKNKSQTANKATKDDKEHYDLNYSDFCGLLWIVWASSMQYNRIILTAGSDLF